MGPTWGLSGADRTQVGPKLVPRTLLSGTCNQINIQFNIQIFHPCPNFNGLWTKTPLKHEYSSYRTLWHAITSRRCNANCDDAWVGGLFPLSVHPSHTWKHLATVSQGMRFTAKVPTKSHRQQRVAVKNSSFHQALGNNYSWEAKVDLDRVCLWGTK